MARWSRSPYFRSYGFAWYASKRMGRTALRVAENLARGSKKEWDHFAIIFLEEIGCRCLFQPVIRKAFSTFLQSLLNTGFVHMDKARLITKRLEKNVAVANCRLRREQRKRQKAVSRASKAEATIEELSRHVPACVICFTTEGLTVLTPCGHACVCSECAAEITLCPMCRSVVEATHRVYL